MIQTILNILKAALGSLKNQRQLTLENLLLRQQIIVLQRTASKPKFKNSDRRVFAWLSKKVQSWKDILIIVKPETVIKWHKASFKLFWRWKSRVRSGRRRKDAEIRALIRKMCDSNPLWGCPSSRLHPCLKRLGYSTRRAYFEG